MTPREYLDTQLALIGGLEMITDDDRDKLVAACEKAAMAMGEGSPKDMLDRAVWILWQARVKRDQSL
jgi:hypothetical protein